jgi:hypothetical protein
MTSTGSSKSKSPASVVPDQLRDLAKRVRRLSPDRMNPEKFFMEKDDIASQLATLAGQEERKATVRQ